MTAIFTVKLHAQNPSVLHATCYVLLASWKVIGCSKKSELKT